MSRLAPLAYGATTRQADLVEQRLALLSRCGLETRDANALEARRERPSDRRLRRADRPARQLKLTHYPALWLKPVAIATRLSAVDAFRLGLTTLALISSWDR